MGCTGICEEQKSKLRTNTEKSATQPDLTILISRVQYLLYLHSFLIFPEQQKCNFQLVPLTVVNYRVPLTYSLIPFSAQAVSRNWVHRPVIFTFGYISRRNKQEEKKGEKEESKRRRLRTLQITMQGKYMYGYYF